MTLPVEVRRIVPLLLLLAMASPLTLNILQASVPGLSTALKAPKETVQLTLSLYLAGMAVSQVISGPLADRYGRRPAILIALGIFVMASLAASLSPSIETLIIARIGQALGATSCLALSRTIIADISDRSTTAKVIATITMVMVIAPMAAPSIGGYLDRTFGWPSIFLFCASLGLITLLACHARLKETRPAAMHGATFGDVGRRTLALARNSAFLRYAGVASFASAMFFAMLGATPHIVIGAMQRHPAEFALWYALLGGGYAVGNFTITRNSHRLASMMLIGNGLALTGGVIILTLAAVPVMHPAAIFLPALFITYGNGLAMPTSIASGIQTDRNAGGAASGLMGFCQMSLGAVVSYVAGLLPNGTALPMALIILACGIMAVLLSPRR